MIVYKIATAIGVEMHISMNVKFVMKIQQMIVHKIVMEIGVEMQL